MFIISRSDCILSCVVSLIKQVMGYSGNRIKKHCFENFDVRARLLEISIVYINVAVKHINKLVS